MINSASNSLIRVIGDYGVTLPRNAIEWRVCYNPQGSPGQPGQHILHGQVTQLVTDGIVSWFLLGDHQTIFFGHKANFEPDKEESDPSLPKLPRKHISKPITDPKLIALAMQD